jgi:hypothetical protein
MADKRHIYLSTAPTIQMLSPMSIGHSTLTHSAGDTVAVAIERIEEWCRQHEYDAVVGLQIAIRSPCGIALIGTAIRYQ